jgi:hypothetical protein
LRVNATVCRFLMNYRRIQLKEHFLMMWIDASLCDFLNQIQKRMDLPNRRNLTPFPRAQIRNNHTRKPQFSFTQFLSITVVVFGYLYNSLAKSGEKIDPLRQMHDKK